jgi:hypothetical protein
MTTKALHPATSHRRSELRGAARHIALAMIGGALLLGFAVIVVREVLATVGVVAPARDDSYELFAVSLTGLAGGAFAAGVRADQAAPRSTSAGARERDDRWRGAIMSSFVAVYVAAGAVALVVCLVRLGASTSVLRGLAATFLGTSVATLTIFLDVPSSSSEDG